MSFALHHTRASCAARRTAEELCGGTGTSSRYLMLAVCLTGLLAQGCTGSTTSAEADLRLDGALPTMEALGVHVMTALSRQDTAALNSLRLTEAEHNGVVWPELPASAPEVNYPVDYAWTNIQNRNTRGLSRLLPIFEDRTPGYQRVECRGESQSFRTFVVHTDCWVVFTIDGSPRLWEAQLFKDVLVRGGGHKIFRYYDEEPRLYRGAGGTRP